MFVSILLVVLLTGWKLNSEGEGRIVRENLRVPDLVQAINAAAGLTIKIRLLDLPGRQHTNYTDKLVYPVITLVATLQHPLALLLWPFRPRRCPAYSNTDYLFNRRAPVIYDRFCFYRFLQTNIIDGEWGLAQIFHSSRPSDVAWATATATECSSTSTAHNGKTRRKVHN